MRLYARPTALSNSFEFSFMRVPLPASFDVRFFILGPRHYKEREPACQQGPLFGSASVFVSASPLSTWTWKHS
jgi:hypothetical protein